MRIAYIGTETANLHQLVRSHETNPTEYLHYPISSFRPPLPWKPTMDLINGHYITPDVLADLSSFPMREVRDALVDTYFAEIHPGVPIVDEADFRRRYADPDNPPPLLLFHAILLAAARISDHPLLAGSRATATTTLHRRARALFNLRYENDRLLLVQAAFLMAGHTENSDTIGANSYHWIGNAVRVAFGLGMHRNGANIYLPAYESRTHRVFKKVWWALVYAEVFLALEFGRPCMIRRQDFDLGSLEEDDFKNMDDSEDALVDREFCRATSEVCLVALDILDLHAPRSVTKDDPGGIARIDQQLAALALRMPFAHDFWSCQFRLNYNLVVLILHRTEKPAEAGSLCSEAASNILTTFETMAIHGTIRRCHHSASTAMCAAAIQFSREVRSAIARASGMKAISAHAQLERIARPAKILAEYCVEAEAIYWLCMRLSARAETLIKDYQTPTSVPPATPEMSVTTDLGWQAIFAEYQPLYPAAQPSGTDFWFNTF